MSKGKLNRLVIEKWVDGWDDPRLMPLAGLQRCGVSSTASLSEELELQEGIVVNFFIRGIGITRRYMGTITWIDNIDPVNWPNSHWRSVKVGWDESTAGQR
ncbi:glutamine--tRNA ligase-like [Canna indica]|uniref:Glutamine--tRNA ligase-like n=1 Tax=Canna indica TaxID=4628 RepID=A0AAQ3KM71_9LILI|nr:glutamine--tRNA ligase-like [Canna indica]